jgi:hypothetical protein
MPCDTWRAAPEQTLTQRKTQVTEIIQRITVLLAKRTIKVAVDKKTGAITFDGIPSTLRQGVSDACVYRRLIVGKNPVAAAEIKRAEAAAGRPVSSAAVAQGIHSHDGGQSWHAKD